ncbi:hypothetical protein M0R19_03340 [Candidatus Pacearchaeota archaeon]|nr:hypothetical protein [Candidatus Pacearchaeota archaeon]
MKITSALKTLEKMGYNVRFKGNHYWVTVGDNTIDMFTSSVGEVRDIRAFRVRKSNETDDLSGAFAGTFELNLSQSLKKLGLPGNLSEMKKLLSKETKINSDLSEKVEEIAPHAECALKDAMDNGIEY